MKISVIGLGYVGLIQAAGMAKLGFSVVGTDIDKDKVDMVNRQEPPIYEKGLKEALCKIVPSKFTATTNLKKAIMDTDMTFICVGTPSKKQGEMSLHQLENVVVKLGEIIKSKPYHVFVIKSTVIPGTCETIVVKGLEKSSGKTFPKDFSVVMNPEFLKEGEAIEDFFKPDRIVIGSSDKKGLGVLKEAYSQFTCPIIETEFKEAEMIKYASNSFLATKISFINEIGNICKKYGVDTNVVAKGIGLDHRISPHFLKSGIGFGGSCFPKDVNAIIYKATELGYNPRLLRSVLDINRDQPLKLIEQLDKAAGPIKGKKVGLLGLTFKAGTDDIRESPALNTIKELLMEEAELFIYDPQAMEKVKKIFPHLNYMESAQEVADASEYILILTEWNEFLDVDYKKKLVIDGKNLFGDKKPSNYQGICW
ncbi:MAG: UDP-glucose/GDP-mannose dehydrogenase family protein [archaeon]